MAEPTAVTDVPPQDIAPTPETPHDEPEGSESPVEEPTPESPAQQPDDAARSKPKDLHKRHKKKHHEKDGQRELERSSEKKHHRDSGHKRRSKDSAKGGSKETPRGAAKDAAPKEPGKEHVFVYSSQPSMFHGRRIQQLQKEFPERQFSDFWFGYGCYLEPSKLVFFHVYENVFDDFRADLRDLQTVYPDCPVFIVILNTVEYNLEPPKTFDMPHVHVVNIVGNVLEKGDAFDRLIQDMR